MISTVETFQHLIQEAPGQEVHLLVALPEQPLDRFEVTEMIRDGDSLVLRCGPMEKKADPAPASQLDDADHSQDDSDYTFYKNDEVAFLSRHDPLRLYEDLR
jgi:hypothetical protein